MARAPRLLRTLPTLPLALEIGCARSSSTDAVPALDGAVTAAAASPSGRDRDRHRVQATLGESAASPYRVRYDQVGYSLDADRFAVVVSSGLSAPHYRIHDATTQCAVAEGTAGPRVLQTTSRAGTPLTGDRIDLSALAAGRYVLVLEDGSWTGPIVIGKDVDAPILPLVARFLAEQRCGPTTKSASVHDACALFRPSRARPEGFGLKTSPSPRGTRGRRDRRRAERILRTAARVSTSKGMARCRGSSSSSATRFLRARRGPHGASRPRRCARHAWEGACERAALGARLAAQDGRRRRAASPGGGRGRSRPRLADPGRRYRQADRCLRRAPSLPHGRTG